MSLLRRNDFDVIAARRQSQRHIAGERSGPPRVVRLGVQLETV